MTGSDSATGLPVGALLVGLTGGTGSGKSTLAATWAECGARVVDADAFAREVVARGTPGLTAIVAEFGPDVVDTTGDLRRAELAAIVFADPARLRTLEQITHPLIEARTRQAIAQAGPGEVLIHDMPLIVERGTAADYHLVVVVDAPVELRVERLVGRGMASDDARRRIAAQAETAARAAVADLWGDNSGSPADLARLGQHWWHTRLAPFAANLAAARPTERSVRVTAPDPDWPAQGRRLTARLQRWLGSEFADVSVTAPADFPSDDVLAVQVSAESRADVDGLARCGFVPATAGADPEGFASADPGRPATLTWLTRSEGRRR